MGKLVHRAESPVRQLFAVSGQEDRRKGGDLFPAAVAVEHSGGVQAAVHSALHIVPAVAHHQHPLALHDGLGEDVADDVGLVVAALIHGRTAHEGEVRRKALLFEDGPHNVGGLAGGRAEGQARSLETAQHLHHAGVDIALVAAPGGVFLPAMRELTTSVLLYGPNSRTLGVAIYQLRINGQIAPAAALSVITILLIIICNNVVKHFTKDRKGS